MRGRIRRESEGEDRKGEVEEIMERGCGRGAEKGRRRGDNGQRRWERRTGKGEAEGGIGGRE